MMARLLLSLRKASDPARVAQWNVDHFSRPTVFTESHFTLNTLKFANMDVSKNVDSGLELSDNGQPGASDDEDNVAREVPAV